MKKRYSFGLLVGRFQSIHIGHEMIVNTALEQCDSVGIFVGSSQESRTAKNPFSYEERKRMLYSIFGDAVTVRPLPDIGVGNNPRWGDYVLKAAEERFGKRPDVLITGEEERRSRWFDETGIPLLSVPKTARISASLMREYLIQDRFDMWKKFVNPKLLPQYQAMRKIVLVTKDQIQTNSL